jgi:hypothetical protein
MNPPDKTPRSSSRRIQKALNEERATRIVEAYLRERLPQVVIARKEGVSQATVATVIVRAKEEWRERRALSLAEQQDEELAKLDDLTKVAWQCFQLSRLPAGEIAKEREKRLESLEDMIRRLGKARTSINGRKNGSPGVPRMLRVPELKVVAERLRESAKERPEGNVRFLELVRWGIETRMRILGMLQTGDTLIDARSGPFTDIWEQMITPPGNEEPENEVEKRLRELAQKRQERIEIRAVDDNGPQGGATERPDRIEKLPNGTDATDGEW